MSPDQFRIDLEAAEAAGIAASNATKDVGSMSMDDVHIAIGKGCAISRKTKAWDAACGGCYIRSGMWRGYLITPVGSGVASARLASAEAMAKVLRERGWNAGVFYRMD